MRAALLGMCLVGMTACSTVEGWLGMDDDETTVTTTTDATADTATLDTFMGDSTGSDIAHAGDSSSAEPVNPDCDLVPTLQSIEEQYFGPSCTFSSCHDSDNPAGALDLTIGNSHAALLDVVANGDPSATLVVPGDPDNSYLVHRVEGTSGVFMPPGVTEALDPDCRIATLRAWILAGAPID